MSLCVLVARTGKGSGQGRLGGGGHGVVRGLAAEV